MVNVIIKVENEAVETIEEVNKIYLDELAEEVEENTLHDRTDQDYINNILAIINGEIGEYPFHQKNGYTEIVIYE